MTSSERDRSERTADGTPGRGTLYLLASVAVVTFATFRLLEPAGLPGTSARAARGAVMLGVLFFGAAALALLGLAPAPPAVREGRPWTPLLRRFFGAPGVPGEDPPGPDDSYRDARGHAPPRGRHPDRPAGGAGRRVRLGWARLSMSLGVVSLLLGGLLSLHAYSAAVLMLLAGLLAIVALRSP